MAQSAGRAGDAAAAVTRSANGPLKLHVLIVDDEVVNRSVAKRMLQRLGCTTVELSDGIDVEPLLLQNGLLPVRTASATHHSGVRPVAGHDGVNWYPGTVLGEHDSGLGLGTPSELVAAPSPFDVILLDIQMRQMNGDVLCRNLRDAGMDTIIVATTGNCSEVEVDSYLNIGFDAVLPKVRHEFRTRPSHLLLRCRCDSRRPHLVCNCLSQRW